MYHSHKKKTEKESGNVVGRILYCCSGRTRKNKKKFIHNSTLEYKLTQNGNKSKT